MLFDNIFGSEAVAAYFNAAYNPENTIARSLFPIQSKVGINLKWIKGTKGVTPSLAPSAFDTKATLRSRDGIKVTETQMPYFKEGIKLTETDRQELLQIGAYDSALRDRIVSEYFDDAATLVNAANVVPERMVYQLLFPENGIPAINFADNGATYSYTYGDQAWKDSHFVTLTGNDLWTAASTADPIANINDMKTKLRTNNGSIVKYLLMNSNTFNLIGKCTSVKNLFVLTNGNAVNAALLGDQVRALVERACGCAIILNDNVYMDENGVTQAFVPDGMVAFLPDGTLGTTYRATTPAEADLMGKQDVDVSIVDNGIAIAVKTSDDPVNVNTIVSQIVLPTYERIDSVGLAKVTA